MTVTVNIPIERYEELIAIEKAHEKLTNNSLKLAGEELAVAILQGDQRVDKMYDAQSDSYTVRGLLDGKLRSAKISQVMFNKFRQGK